MSATVVTSGFGVLLKRGDGGSGAAVQASRTIGSSNSQLVLKAKTAGAAGNSKACEIVVSGNNTALAVSVSATLVTITSKTDGSANPTSTINDIIAKLYQNATFVANWEATSGAGTGAGTLAAAAALAFLTSGADGGEAFTTIAEVTGLGGPGETLELIDATHMESPSGYREYIPSLLDSGEISVDLNFLPGTAGQTGLRSDLVNKVRRNFEMVWTDGDSTTYSFAGYVTNIEPSASIDDKLSASATIKVTGPISVA